MIVTVTGRHFDLTADLKTYVEERLARYDKFADGLISAHVVLGVEKYRQTAEFSVHGRSGDFKGKAESSDMLTSIDAAYEKVEKQIRRQATKRKARTKAEPKGEIAMGDIRMEAERRSREMMTLEEAATRVESGEEIVVFADTDSGATRVVFRRQDGTLKMIEVAN